MLNKIYNEKKITLIVGDFNVNLANYKKEEAQIEQLFNLNSKYSKNYTYYKGE